MRILIVGGGIGGMATAIALSRRGHEIDLIDLDPEWRVYGAGITITRPTMRAFRLLGVLDEVERVGFAGDGIQICRADGTAVEKVADPVMRGAPLPGSGGIMRPDLHRILSQRVLAGGARVRLGLTVDELASDDNRVDVRFSDGTRSWYDFVVGADGVYSRVRTLIFPDAPRPEYTGQTVWRLFAPRPPEVTRRQFFLGGPSKVGLCPVSDTHLYMFLLENTPRRPIIPDAELPGELRRLLAGYGGPIRKLRDDLGPGANIVVRPLEAFRLPAPWYAGRVLLIGDAAHPTTPQLASGAGIAVEDALVLADELGEAGDTADVADVFRRFMARREPRCRLVVDHSIEIGRREQAGRPAAEQTVLVEEALAKLAEPI